MSGNLAVGPMSAQPLRTATAPSGSSTKLTAEQRAGLAQEIIDCQNTAVDRLFKKVLSFYITETKYAVSTITSMAPEEIKKHGLVAIAFGKEGSKSAEGKGLFIISHVENAINAAQDKVNLSQCEKICLVFTIRRLSQRLLASPKGGAAEWVLTMIDQVEMDGRISKGTNKSDDLSQSRILKAAMLEVIKDYRSDIENGKYKPALLTNEKIWTFAKA